MKLEEANRVSGPLQLQPHFLTPGQGCFHHPRGRPPPGGDHRTSIPGAPPPSVPGGVSAPPPRAHARSRGRAGPRVPGGGRATRAAAPQPDARRAGQRFAAGPPPGPLRPRPASLPPRPALRPPRRRPRVVPSARQPGPRQPEARTFAGVKWRPQ